MGIGVLGPLVVDGVASISPRDRVVLGVLVVRRGEYVTPDVLADALWGAAPPASAAKVVQGCVSRLRRLLGPGTIESTPQGYRLALTGDELDLSLFERQLRTARQHLTDGDPDRASYVVGQALTLWRGDPLADLEEWPPGHAESVRLRELRLDAEEVDVAAAVDRGHAADVVDRARSMVGQARYRERRWELWALALYRADRQRDALAVLQQARRTLREDLGLEPGPSLSRLQEQVLRHDPELAAQGEVVAEAECPYRGLLPYEAEDAESFFGREADLSACLALLRHERRLVVVGPSGCGKSSLVRAGVVASLRADGEKVALTRPGTRPLDSWPVRGNGPRPTVVVDQAEEVLTLCHDTHERAAYLTTLVEYDGPLVLAWRADRLGELTGDPRLARMVERGLHLLSGLDDRGLRDVVERPAAQAGLRLEPGLADLLVRDVEGEPGALPLLSHVLRETWEHREGRTLTVAGYHATGGVRDALARSAEGLYAELDPRQRSWLRSMVQRLVVPTDDGDISCAKVPRRTLVADPEHEQLVERLVHARLLSGDGEDLQLAHEALAREWPRLQNWLAEDGVGQRLLRHLSVAAVGWDGLGRPESELYRGSRLTAAVEWAAERTWQLTEVERDFLDASVALDDRETRSAHEQLRLQRRANRRLRGALAAAVLLMVAGLVAGQLALRQADRAQRETVAAQRAGRSAEAHRVALLAAGQGDLSAALLLALEARRLEDTTETRDRLGEVLARDPHLVATYPEAGGYDLAVSPDAASVAVARPDTLPGLLLLDAGTGAELATSQYAYGAVRYLDRSTLLAGGFWRTGDPVMVHPVALLDATTLVEQPVQLGRQPTNSRAKHVSASADGRFVAAHLEHQPVHARSDYSLVEVWDRRHPARPLLRIRDPRTPGLLALSRDGSRMTLAWTGTHLVTTYDVRTGRVLRRHDLGGRAALGAFSGAASPDGRTFVLTLDRDVVLLDAQTLREQRRWQAAGGSPFRPEFSPDSRLVATSTVEQDGGATVWDATSGRAVAQIGRSYGAQHVTAAFAPDGHTVFASDGSGVRRYRLDSESGLVHDLPAQALGRSAHWHEASPNGRLVAHAGLDGTRPGHGLVQVVDLDTGRIVRSFSTPRTNDHPPSWSPDGRHLAMLQGRRLLTLDVLTGRQRSSAELGLDAYGVAYAGDGSLLTVVDWRGDLHVLDASTLAVRREVPALVLQSVHGAPGSPYVVGLNGNTLWRIDPTTGRSTLHDPKIEDGPEGLWDAALSPDGDRAAVTGATGVGLYDLEGDRWIARPSRRGVDVTFSSDGRWFAATRGNQVTMWDGRDGSYVSSVRTGSSVDSDAGVAFQQDPGEVLVIGENGDLHEWSFDPAAWTGLACRLAGRNLTEAEWKGALGDRPYHATCPLPHA